MKLSVFLNQNSLNNKIKKKINYKIFLVAYSFFLFLFCFRDCHQEAALFKTHTIICILYAIDVNF